jgi:ABC-type transport system substrate-binding protein
MKWFYGISLIVVGTLAIAPFALVPRQDAGDYAGMVVLRDSYRSPIKSLDPATCGDTGSGFIQSNVFEGLYTYHYLLRPAKVIPLLAAAMPEVSPDGLVYTIRLRDDAMYHRNACFGTEQIGGKARFKTRRARADDFILAMKRCADHHVKSGLSWAFLSGRIEGLDDWRDKSKQYKPGDFSRYDLPVSGLTAPDANTLRMVLRAPYPQLQYVLAMSVYAPIPREAVDYWLATEDDGNGGRRPVPVEKCPTEFREACQCVGTGPYLMSIFERKKRIVQIRNPEFRPDFYPAEGSDQDRADGLLDDAGKRVPFVDVLKLDFVSEDYPSWMRFLSSQTDISGIPPEAFDSVITPGRELSDKWRQQGIRLLKYELPTLQWVAFNMRDKVLGGSKSLRQALCLCFDVESQIRILYNGRGVRATTIIPRSIPGWKDAGAGPYYRFDVQAAKAKLQEAKRELAAKGLLGGGEIPTLKLDMGGTGQNSVKSGEFAKQQFARIGVKLEVAYCDFPVLLTKIQNKTVQMYQSGWHSDYPDAENFLQLFYSPNIVRGTNNSNYSNPEFDRLYEQARTMSDSPERRDLYGKMMRMVCEDCPVLPLSEPQSFLLMHDWVRNVKPHPFGYGYVKYRRVDTGRQGMGR